VLGMSFMCGLILVHNFLLFLRRLGPGNKLKTAIRFEEPAWGCTVTAIKAQATARPAVLPVIPR
jgi:hypothetical protein